MQDPRKALATGAPFPPKIEWPRHPLDGKEYPTANYNGMLHPLVPFAIRGAIWYQGESNHGDGMKYFAKMKGLIAGWRKVWGQGDFPFYFVQLAPYQRYRSGELPLIWEAQTASMSIPNTGMAVTIDIGNVNDIHPGNKQDVGKRLALWALAKTYHRSDITFSGPLYRSMSIEGHKFHINFDHIGSGLTTRDNQPLSWFAIAGKDRKYLKAQAIIDGDQVVVWSESIKAPVAVRFGWQKDAQPNLCNREGLPAAPFRTDRW